MSMYISPISPMSGVLCCFVVAVCLIVHLLLLKVVYCLPFVFNLYFFAQKLKGHTSNIFNDVIS